MQTSRLTHKEQIPKANNNMNLVGSGPFSRSQDMNTVPLLQSHNPTPSPLRASTTAFSVQDMHRYHGQLPLGQMPSTQQPASAHRFFSGASFSSPQQNQQYHASTSAHQQYRNIPHTLGLGAYSPTTRSVPHFSRGKVEGEDHPQRNLREFGVPMDTGHRSNEDGAGDNGFAFAHPLLGGSTFREGHHASSFDSGAIPGVASMAGIGLSGEFVADGLQRRFVQGRRQRSGRRLSQMTEKEKKDRHNAHTRSSRLRIDQGLLQLKNALLKANPNLRLNKKADIVDAAVKYVMDAYPGLQLQESSLSS